MSEAAVDGIRRPAKRAPPGRAFRQGLAWLEDGGDSDAGPRPVVLTVGGTDGFARVPVLAPDKDLVVLIAASKPRIPVERIRVALSRHLP